MNKLRPDYIHGIPYLRLSSISIDMLVFLRDWISESDITEIEGADGTTYSYVQYSQYDFWFENVKSFTRESEEADF